MEEILCINCLYSERADTDTPCCECKRSAKNEIDRSRRLLLWKPKKDMVNHPSHYNQGKYECIDVMLETFGQQSTQDFCLLNAFKYIWRSGTKNGNEDIEKAIWYLNKYLELEGEE